LGRCWQLDELIGAFLFTAINRFATPIKLANFFVSLCSDRASYSVGSTYFVDGGMLKTI
jgi:3-oxoacyl-[acyl-carrier protein] reductase